MGMYRLSALFSDIFDPALLHALPLVSKTVKFEQGQNLLDREGKPLRGWRWRRILSIYF